VSCVLVFSGLGDKHQSGIQTSFVLVIICIMSNLSFVVTPVFIEDTTDQSTCIAVVLEGTWQGYNVVKEYCNNCHNCIFFICGGMKTEERLIFVHFEFDTAVFVTQSH